VAAQCAAAAGTPAAVRVHGCCSNAEGELLSAGGLVLPVAMAGQCSRGSAGKVTCGGQLHPPAFPVSQLSTPGMGSGWLIGSLQQLGVIALLFADVAGMGVACGVGASSACGVALLVLVRCHCVPRVCCSAGLHARPRCATRRSCCWNVPTEAWPPHAVCMQACSCASWC
jgi:hypothetical protein